MTCQLPLIGRGNPCISTLLCNHASVIGLFPNSDFMRHIRTGMINLRQVSVKACMIIMKPTKVHGAISIVSIESTLKVN